MVDTSDRNLVGLPSFFTANYAKLAYTTEPDNDSGPPSSHEPSLQLLGPSRLSYATFRKALDSFAQCEMRFGR